MQCFKIFNIFGNTWHVDRTFQQKECFPCLCKQIPNPSKLQLILQTSQEEAENIKSILLKLCKHSKQRCMFLLSLFPATFIQVSTKTNKYLFSSIHIYCPYLPFLLMFLKAQTCILSKSSKGWLLRVKLVEALHLMPPKSSKLANFLNILKAWSMFKFSIRFVKEYTHTESLEEQFRFI